MTMLADLLALIPLWALGFATQHALGIRRDDAAAIVLDLVIGVTLLAVIGSVSIPLGSTPALWWIYFLIVVVGALAWLRRLRQPRTEVSTTQPQDWSDSRRERMIGLLILTVLLFLTATAFTDRLTWDGWAIWALRARILFYENAFPPDVFEKPGPYEFAHPEYPLALPLLEWWVYRHAREPSPALASLIGSLWVSALAVVAWRALRPRTNATVAGLAVLGLVLFRPLTHNAVGGTADVIISLALLGAVSELEFADSFANGAATARAGSYLALAALSKNEGLALAVIALLVVSLTRRVYGWSRLRVALAFGLPAAAGLAWLVYTRTWGLEVEQVGGVPAMNQWLDRAAAIGSALVGLTMHRSWPPIILLGLLGTIAWFNPRNARPLHPGPMLVVGYFIVIVAVYFSTTQNLDWLLGTSLDRVLSHLVPAVLVLAVLAIWTPDSARSTAPFRPAP